MVLTDKHWQEIQQRRAAWAHAIERSALAQDEKQRMAALAELRTERDTGNLPDYDDLEALYLAVEAYRPIVEAMANLDAYAERSDDAYACIVCGESMSRGALGYDDEPMLYIAHDTDCAYRQARTALGMLQPPAEAGT